MRLCEDSPFTNTAGFGIYNSLQIKFNSLLSCMLQSVQIMYITLKPLKICPSVSKSLEYLPLNQGGLENKYSTLWMDRHKLAKRMVSVSQVWSEVVNITQHSQLSHTSRILLRIIHFCMQCLNPLIVSTANKIYQHNTHN